MNELNEGFTKLDDPGLFSWRAEARAELERLPPASVDHAKLSALYEQSTLEVVERAREARAAELGSSK